MTITNRLFKTALAHGNILDELQTDDYYFLWLLFFFCHFTPHHGVRVQKISQRKLGTQNALHADNFTEYTASKG